MASAEHSPPVAPAGEALAAGHGVLSCYTANLLAYAERLDAGARSWMARSIRTAILLDLPGRRLRFSHHCVPVDRLPGGERLTYADAADAGRALAAIRAELGRCGAVLVVAHSAALPWSPGGPGAPHWLLVDGVRGRRWHVLDRFGGQLPEGRQEPFEGWLDEERLVVALEPRTPTPEQRDRDALAFGHWSPPPRWGTFRWLERRPPPHPEPLRPGRWLEEAAALDGLARFFTGPGSGAGAHLDDVWAVARHQRFRLAWLRSRPGCPPAAAAALERTDEAWDALPQALRFAVGSAARGRPRPGLVQETVARVVELHGHAPGWTQHEERNP